MIRGIPFVLLMVLAISGCKTHTDSASQAESEKPEEKTAKQQPAPEPKPESPPPRSGVQAGERASPTDNYARLAPDINAGRTEEGPGLTFMIDGSSVQAYNESMELIASETSQLQYDNLTEAIALLRMMTLSAKTTEEFFKTLDGMTGEEIIAEVERRRGGRNRG